MNVEDRMNCYRGWVARLACAIYNGEEWDKQEVAAYLHMGESSLNYAYRDEPPERLEMDEAIDAMDRIFEQGGI